jgi:error-prone DNA polymerase
VDGPFSSEYDLQRRLPSIRRTEPGAFNWTGEKHHRRTALWRAERAAQSVGPLFADIPDEHELETSAPLLPMTTEERLVADFGGTGLTMGPHLMAYHRADMNRADLRTEFTSRYSTLLTHYAKCLKCQGA